MRKVKPCKTCIHFYKDKFTYIYKRKRLPSLFITKKTPFCRMLGEEAEGGRIRGGYPSKCFLYHSKIDLDRFMGTKAPDRRINRIQHESGRDVK